MYFLTRDVFPPPTNESGMTLVCVFRVRNVFFFHFAIIIFKKLFFHFKSSAPPRNVRTDRWMKRSTCTVLETWYLPSWRVIRCRRRFRGQKIIPIARTATMTARRGRDRYRRSYPTHWDRRPIQTSSLSRRSWTNATTIIRRNDPVHFPLPMSSIMCTKLPPSRDLQMNDHFFVSFFP